MNTLLVAGLEAKMTVFDMRTHNAKTGFASVTQTAHKSTVWCGAHLPQNRDVFATTGGNGSIYLWQYKYPAKRVAQDADGKDVGVPGELVELNRAALGTQPISTIDWSMDKLGLAVTSAFDQCIRVVIVTKLNSL